jgi:hypothetical protein
MLYSSGALAMPRLFHPQDKQQAHTAAWWGAADMKNKKFVLIGTVILSIILFTGIFYNTGAFSKSEKSDASDQIGRYMEQNRQELEQVKCYCGCDHTSLYDCYEEKMLTNCGICMGEYNDFRDIKGQGKNISEISAYIDSKYKGTEDTD